MTKRRPAGLLVLYDEGRGLAKTQVKVFNPSPTIDRDVNDWIDEADVAVHRIDWLPSGGQLGASVTYSKGEEATQAVRVMIPGLESLEKRLAHQKPLEKTATTLLFVGVALGLLSMALFTMFFPETWYGGPDQVTDPDTAVKWTVLTGGLGVFLVFGGLAAMFRSRIT